MNVRLILFVCGLALPLLGAPRVSVDNLPNHQRFFESAVVVRGNSRLTLVAGRGGSIARIGFTGDSLEIGRQYSVKAFPSPFYWFSGWEGDVSTMRNPMTFTMQSNLVIKATFVPSPFPSLCGEYNGLFYPSDGLDGIGLDASATNSGFVTLNLRSSGAFSGRLALAGRSIPLSGDFGRDLQSHVVISQVTGVPVTMDLWLDGDTLTLGGVVAQPGAWSSDLRAYRAAKTASNFLASRYTLLLEGCDKNGACFLHARVPYGDSPATLKIMPSGAIQMVGTLSDGKPFSQRVKLSESGLWPLYATPYGNKGLVLGWLDFSVEPGVMSRVMWQKPSRAPGDHYYTNTFSSMRIALLSPVTPPANCPGFPANCLVEINSGDLPEKLISEVAMTENPPTVLRGEIPDLSLTLDSETGQFRGSFVHPTTREVIHFRGALNTTPPAEAPYYGYGGGWFLGPSGQSGIIRLLAK